MDWLRLVQIGSDWLDRDGPVLVKIGSDWIGIGLGMDWFRLDRDRDWTGLVKIGLDWIDLDRDGSDWHGFPTARPGLARIGFHWFEN